VVTFMSDHDLLLLAHAASHTLYVVAALIVQISVIRA